MKMYSLLEKDKNYYLKSTSEINMRTRKTAVIDNEGCQIVASVIATGSKNKLTTLMKKMSGSKPSRKAKNKKVDKIQNETIGQKTSQRACQNSIQKTTIKCNSKVIKSTSPKISFDDENISKKSTKSEEKQKKNKDREDIIESKQIIMNTKGAYAINDEGCETVTNVIASENDHQYESEMEQINSFDDSSKRRSLQEIIDSEFMELECSWNPTPKKTPTTMEEIMEQLDDPELNMYSEPEVIEDLSSSVDLNSMNPHDIHDFSYSNKNDKQQDEVEEKYIDVVNDDPRNEEDETYDFSQCQADSTWREQSNVVEDSENLDTTNANTTNADETVEPSFNTATDPKTPTVIGKINDEKLSAKPKTKTTKYDFCFYCKQLKAVISRHLEIKHADKPEVKKFSVLPKYNPERRKIIETIRLEGNYIYNTDKNYNKTGDLIVARRPKKERAATDYEICHNCKCTLSKKTIRRHRQACIGGSSKGERSNVILSRRIAGRLHEDTNERLAKIFTVLREDDITRLVRYDELLMRFGNSLCDKYRKPQQDAMIRNRLRTLGRLLKEMKDIDSTITDFKSIYHPKLYKTMLKAVKKMAGFDPERGEFDVPSIITSMGTYIKTVGETLKLYWVENVDDEKEKFVDKYLFLHKMQYSQTVNRIAVEDQAKKHRQNARPLPITEDVRKLSEYLQIKRREAYASLDKGYSYAVWLDLLKYTLMSIQVFNRRRAGEIERTEIADLQTTVKITAKNNPDVYNSLTEEQKKMVGEYSRSVIVGKKDREVPVLLDNEMEDSLSLILEHRKLTKIPKGNPYIFGVPGFSDGRFKYLRACDLMRQFSSECGAKYPERLRGTDLRKHMATTCAAQNMDENEIVDVANFMGHEEKIHRSHYRQSVVTRDVIGIAKILRRAAGQDESINNENPPNCLQTDNEFDQPSTSSCQNEKKKSASVKKRIRKVISSSESSFDDEYNDNFTFRGKPKKKQLKVEKSRVAGIDHTEKKKKIRWTDEEKYAAFDAFGRIIRNNNLPSTTEIKEFLKNHPSITRSVDQIRAWASNEKKKFNMNNGD